MLVLQKIHVQGNGRNSFARFWNRYGFVVVSNFKTFSKLQVVITTEKLEIPTCGDLLTEKPKLPSQNTEAANGRADFLTMGCL